MFWRMSPCSPPVLCRAILYSHLWSTHLEKPSPPQPLQPLPPPPPSAASILSLPLYCTLLALTSSFIWFYRNVTFHQWPWRFLVDKPVRCNHRREPGTNTLAAPVRGMAGDTGASNEDWSTPRDGGGERGTAEPPEEDGDEATLPRKVW